jgi:hypothetical protein
LTKAALALKRWLLRVLIGLHVGAVVRWLAFTSCTSDKGGPLIARRVSTIEVYVFP